MEETPSVHYRAAIVDTPGPRHGASSRGYLQRRLGYVGVGKAVKVSLLAKLHSRRQEQQFGLAGCQKGADALAVVSVGDVEGDATRDGED